MNFLKTTIIPPNYSITLLLIPTFLYGYDGGSSGGILATMTHHHALSHLQSGLVISSLILGTIIGLLISSRIVKYVNYRTFLVISVITYIVPTVILLLFNSVNAYIYFRIIMGCSIGMITFITPLYLHELKYTGSSTKAFMSLFQIWNVFGFDFAQVCTLILYSLHSWQIIVFLSLLPALLFLFQFRKIPAVFPSAKQKFPQLSDIDVIPEEDTEVNEILSKVENSPFLQTRKFRRISLALSLAVAQVLTGDCIAVYYGPQIYHTMIKSEFNSLLLTFISFMPAFITSCYSRIMADKLSMKKTLILGSTGLTVAMVLLALATIVNHGAALLGLLGTSLVLASFTLTWGPMLWPALTSVLPTKNKERYMALCVGVNSTTLFIISTYTAYFLNKADLLKLFIACAFINVITIVLLSRFLDNNFATNTKNQLLLAHS